MKRVIIKYSVTILLLILAASCKKGWLEAKPKQSLVVPSTLKDLQALLDNTDYFNIIGIALGELGSDDYYVSKATFDGLVGKDLGTYTWAEGNIFAGERIPNWESPYTAIYYANTVLDALQKIPQTPINQSQWNNIKGSALFFRSLFFHSLAQVFCKPYDVSTASTDLGLILRTESNINVPSTRASVEQTYQQVIADLKMASELLPATPLYKTRPSKPAALALLSRVYLTMDDYDNALSYSDATLKMYNVLMNYNSSPYINPALAYPIQFYNPEVIFESRMTSSSLLPSRNGFVDSLLFQVYPTIDKRKTIFFKLMTGNRLAFIGSYEGAAGYNFDGLATDEIYLIRAECYARKQNVPLALQDLGYLQMNRIRTDSFRLPQAANADDALSQILLERRKELPYRGLRWMDLRRLNKDPRFRVTLKRRANGKDYLLPPNDKRYVYPIPDNELLLSGIEQNPR